MIGGDFGGLREEIASPLRRASRELRNTKQLVIELEQVVSEAVSGGASPGLGQIRELQRLDHIVQEIAGVADFLDALSGSALAEWRVDAAQAAASVLLGELGARLGARERVAVSGVSADAESCELF